MAMKQRYFEAFLQGADLAADCGLAEVEHLASVGKAAGLGDGEENSKLVPVHEIPLLDPRAGLSIRRVADCYLGRVSRTYEPIKDCVLY
jgi:hypothetical protein